MASWPAVSHQISQLGENPCVIQAKAKKLRQVNLSCLCSLIVSSLVVQHVHKAPCKAKQTYTVFQTAPAEMF